MSASSLYILLNLAWLKSLGLNGFWLFLAPSGWSFGLDLFQNMFHNLLIYPNILLYLASLKLFRVAGWLGVGVAGWLENLILMKTQSPIPILNSRFQKSNLILIPKSKSPILIPNPNPQS